MQRGAIGLQLGLVGYPADQRVAEPELGPRCERHLIDQFRVQELRQRGAVGEFGEQFLIEPHADDRRGVERLFSRSIETVDPGGDRGLKGGWHGNVRVVMRADVFTAFSLEHVAVGRSRTIDSAKKDCPPLARRSAKSTRQPTDGNPATR